MAKKRGMLAEINHQMKVAAREAEKRQRAREREEAAALRKLEQARKAEERAMAKAARAEAAELKRLQKEAKDAHVAAVMAEAEAMNAELEARREELEGLLAATLEVDDFVDLESLKQTAVHPPFARPDLEPHPLEPAMPPPPRPELQLPPAPSGIAAKFGKKKHESLVAEANQQYQERLRIWEAQASQHKAARAVLEQEHADAERQRAEAKAAAIELYRQECAQREQEVAEQNQAIDTLVANLGYGVADAVEDYVGIVVANSVYPDDLEVGHDFAFDGETAELAIQVAIPAPDTMPTVKLYKYVKASDEIRATELSQKAQKDLYLSVVRQVALRTLHEVFEADRRGLIRSIALQVGAESAHPATGIKTFLPFAAVAAARDEFVQFDLSAVQPEATLQHLGASVSKNPFGLVQADTKGVRGL